MRYVVRPLTAGSTRLAALIWFSLAAITEAQSAARSDSDGVPNHDSRSTGQNEPRLDRQPRARFAYTDIWDVSRQSAPERTVYFPVPLKWEEVIEAKLDEVTEATFEEAPLIEVVAHFSKRHGLIISFDYLSLESAGIALDTPISRTFKDIRLRSALSAILDDLEATFIPQRESLYITTLDAAYEQMAARVYPVGDLLEQDDAESWDDLIISITHSVRLDGRSLISWDEKVGGSISAVRRARAVVVRQTYEGHRQVVELLKSIRAARHCAAEVERAAIRFGPCLQ